MALLIKTTLMLIMYESHKQLATIYDTYVYKLNCLHCSYIYIQIGEIMNLVS